MFLIKKLNKIFLMKKFVIDTHDELVVRFNSELIFLYNN